MPGVGTLAYGNTAKPYRITMLTPTGTVVPVREQSVTCTSYQRPATITENGVTATFAYNAGGDRAKMQVKRNGSVILSRYYIGKQYELDVENSIERLYLGGDAYSAPAVYVKENNVWKIYYICRDYLGSITHIANSDGSLKQELSYDAWGRLRNPATQVAYTPGNEPILFLRRGYTGHEHLYWFGLINMNARLYDPALGRFLSPDPYVQMPDFSQNFNRYSYCLNNPLVYVDETGEFFWIIPNISWSKHGGLSIGFSFVFGIPGGASLQAGIGYNFKSKDVNAFMGATLMMNTAYINMSSSGGVSIGYTAGLSTLSGIPIGTNFTTVGVNYNLSNNSLSGNLSAWTVDKNGFTFDPSFSAMVFPERTTNLVRGQGFRNNNQVLKRFVANGQHQKALDYFGFDGTYRPKKGGGADYVEGTDYLGSTDPTTGDIYYGNIAFDSFDNLYGTYVKESFHQRNARNNTIEMDIDYASDPSTRYMRYFPEEAKGFKHAFKNNGLFPKSATNYFQQANTYWYGAYGSNLISKRWWHFIYKIPRKW